MALYNLKSTRLHMECLTLFQIKVYSFSLSLWVSVTIIVVIFSSEEILLGRMRHTNLKVQNFSIRNLKKKMDGTEN